jgi:LemA protein
MNRKGIGGAAIALIVIGALLLITVLSVISTYNSLVNKDVNVETNWAKVETAYQRRFDLIPNLVETVKGVANFEKSTYLGVAEARTNWAKAQTVNEKIEAGQQFESALSRLMVAVESYPTLKANENFIALQDELSGTENRIKFERDNYNGAVADYKVNVRRFPTNMIAGMFGFTEEKWKMFESQEGAESAPIVNFD